MSAVAPLIETYRTKEIELAREVLSDFMLDAASRTAEEVGFGWVPAEDAPTRFDQLMGAFYRSVTKGVPLPVSSENNNDTMYTTAAANMAFRFVHDVNHIRRQLTFDLADELELAVWHLGMLEHVGFDKFSLPWRMLHADLVGQVHVSALARRFPFDQHRFVRHCVIDGLERGLVHEVRLDADDDDDAANV